MEPLHASSPRRLQQKWNKESRDAFIRRTEKRGDLVATSVQELNDDIKRGSIVVQGTPRDPNLRFCVLDESVVCRDRIEPLRPYAPPEPDNDGDKKRLVHVAGKPFSPTS